jgi:multiple sugar transport system substrate-binding protein
MNEKKGKKSVSIPRRTFLKQAAVTTGALSLGGIPGILATGQAPAYAKGTTLHYLKESHFVPAADKAFLALAKEFGKQAECTVRVERITQNDVRPRTAAAIEAKSGPDIVHMFNNLPHLFANGMIDMDDVAEAIGKAQGGYHEVFKANAFQDGRWVAVPEFGFAWAWAYREDWMKEAGYDKFPETLDGLREFGKTMKAKGKPIGQGFGHSENDPNIYCYSLIWCFGGKELEADGKTVALDSKETIEAVKWNTAFWKDALDEGGLSWDDGSNNRAYISGSISATGNAVSIYFMARDKFPEVYQVTNHAHMPAGPAGRYLYLATQSTGVTKYSKNQKLAKEFVKWFMTAENYEKYFDAGGTFGLPPTKMWHDSTVWTRDPKCTVFRDVVGYSRAIGYAGPPSRKASEAYSKYIIVDMFAKAIQGMPAEEAVKWAANEYRKIYA